MSNVINIVNKQENKQQVNNDKNNRMNNYKSKDEDLSTQASENNNQIKTQLKSNNQYNIGIPIQQPEKKLEKKNNSQPESKSKPNLIKKEEIKEIKEVKEDKDKKVDNIREFIKNQKNHKTNQNEEYVIYLPGRNVYENQYSPEIKQKETERHSLHLEPHQLQAKNLIKNNKNEVLVVKHANSEVKPTFNQIKSKEQNKKKDFEIEIYTPGKNGANMYKQNNYVRLINNLFLGRR